MNVDIEAELRKLRFEDFLYYTFLVATIIFLLANNDTRKQLFGKKSDDASKLLLIAASLILLVFIFLAIRNYKELLTKKCGTQDYSNSKIRFIGSVIIVFGQSLVVIYFLRNLRNV